MVFSGSAVVDAENTSGLCDGAPAVVPGRDLDRARAWQQTQNLAVSLDRGRTWKYPAIP
jgi:sucrose-6-phosphate hydrolase SacC (GH32 family)